MIEKILTDVASFSLMIILMVFLYKQVTLLKEVRKSAEVKVACQVFYLVYSKNSTARLFLKDRIIVKKNRIILENYYCRIPPVCKETEVKGVIEIRKNGTCLEVIPLG